MGPILGTALLEIKLGFAGHFPKRHTQWGFAVRHYIPTKQKARTVYDGSNILAHDDGTPIEESEASNPADAKAHFSHSDQSQGQIYRHLFTIASVGIAQQISSKGMLAAE